MMDFVLEAWVSSNIERAKARWMLGGKQALAAGRETEVAFRRIQRHPQYGFRCTCRRDAAPDPSHPGRGAR